jgi:hypothetical protein
MHEDDPRDGAREPQPGEGVKNVDEYRLLGKGVRHQEEKHDETPEGYFVFGEGVARRNGEGHRDDDRDNGDTEVIKKGGDDADRTLSRETLLQPQGPVSQ